MRFKGLYFIIFAGIVFILFIFFPNITIFRNHISYKQFSVYADTKMNDNIYATLDKVEQQISTSEIYDSSLKYKIFISSDFKNYQLFCPNQRNAFAATYPIINNIFISKTDLKNDLVFREATEDDQRSLSSVISHEVTHKLIENAIGSRANRKLPDWKKEGYCEYISGEELLDVRTAMNKIYTNANSFSSKFSYLKYRMLVTYLLDMKDFSFKDLVETEIDMADLQKEIKNY